MKMRHWLGGLGALVTIIGSLLPDTRNFFQKMISIPIGGIILAVIAAWLVIMSVKNKNGNRIPEKSKTARARRKKEIVYFRKEGVQYALEYPEDEQDIADLIRVSSPRCLTHPVFMTQGHRFGPWVCAGCSHLISQGENEKLSVLAKTEILNRVSKITPIPATMRANRETPVTERA